MKYLCKENCFKEGLYFKAGKEYNMPPDWKPPKSKKEGVVLFEKLTPAVKQRVEAEQKAEKEQAQKVKGKPLPKTGMAAFLAEESEPEE